MDSGLRQLMAELESWESAVEFGIPEDLWAQYQVRLRSDDLYIASMTEIFDALRNKDEAQRKADLAELAKTLLIYTRSAAARYLSGVAANANLLYSAALFYLADYPATAALAARMIDARELLVEQEQFLLALLSKRIDDESPQPELAVLLRGGSFESYAETFSKLNDVERSGLIDDPDLFIAARLSIRCLERFKLFSTWNALREHAKPFNPVIWRPFIENPLTFPLWELFPSQITAVRQGLLSETDDVISLQMPTSAGKTSLCELLIFHEVKARSKKVLFLVPFRALAAEISEGLSRRLEQVGVSVIASYGGNIPTRSETTSIDTADVLIVTPEKFIALSQAMPDLEASFGTIVCDEGHLIDDEGRGLQYELLLTRLKGSSPGERKIVFISAILPNVADIHKWLGGEANKLATSFYKPVEIDFAFIEKKGSTWQLDFNTIHQRPKNYFLARFLTDDDFRFKNRVTGNSNLFPARGSFLSLASAAALKARRNGPVALFTTTKGAQGVAGLVDSLISMIDLGVSVAKGAGQISEQQSVLAQYSRIQLGDEHQLTKALHVGVAFHHGSLPQEIRREIEEAANATLIDILVCTSTLAEGVNLPIRTLVMHTVKRFNGSITEPIPRRSIKNIVGRVGRAGKETRGRIIFANENEKAWVESVFREERMEPAMGALFNLVTQLNRIVVENNLILDNALFERQDVSFLTILDRIDMAIIDLMPADFIIEDIENHVGASLEHTLAFSYFETDELKKRIKEIFLIRARALIENSTPDDLARLRRSGSTPRFQQFVDGTGILDRDEWSNLADPHDLDWLNHVVLPLLRAPTVAQEYDIDWLRALIMTWMLGSTYSEIAILTGKTVNECLDGLTEIVGFVLQDSLSKATQLVLLKAGEDGVSEIAERWTSMLQYGLGNLRQLDLFEMGASDRLGVWSLSRFLDLHADQLRGRDILMFLRSVRDEVILHLRSDVRVPILSANRTIRELRL